MTTEYEDCIALLRRFHITLFESASVHGYNVIEIPVPDEAAGRVTKDHPGVTVVLRFVAGRFVGIVTGEAGDV